MKRFHWWSGAATVLVLVTASEAGITGACCLPTGSCQVRPEAACLEDGGDYQGDGTACATADCPVVRAYEGDGGELADVGKGPGVTEFQIDVDDTGAIGDLAVRLCIGHDFVGDLTIDVEHAGVTVRLVDRPGDPPGSNSDNLEDNFYTFLDGFAPIPDDSPGSSVPSGAYGPSGPGALADFACIDKAGSWTLTITDHANPGEDGCMFSWELFIVNSADNDCNSNCIDDEIETMPLYEIDADAQAAPECEDAPFIAPNITYVSTTLTDGALGPAVPDLFFCGLYVGVIDVFYRYTPAWDGLAFVSVEGPPIDFVYGVYDDCPPTRECLIDCNEIDHFEIIFNAEKGKTYWIRIAAQYFQEGAFELHMIGPDPAFNPVDCNANRIPDECECLADVNGDGVVDRVDLARVLAALGMACECPEDVDGSGVVTVTDAVIVIESAGPCPFP